MEERQGGIMQQFIDAMLNNIRLEQLWLVLDLLLAAVLGFLIGLERKCTCSKEFKYSLILFHNSC